MSFMRRTNFQSFILVFLKENCNFKIPFKMTPILLLVIHSLWQLYKMVPLYMLSINRKMYSWHLLETFCK